MKASEKLIKRMNEELNLDIPLDAYIKRTYAGYWQKSAGAFLWLVYHGETYLVPVIGSMQRVTDLLKCKKLNTWTGMGDIEIMGK